VIDLDALDARIRAIARAESVRPAFVNQRNVETVVGLPRRDYLRLGRAGAFPTTKERRLVIARTVDVLAAFELRLQGREQPVANDADAEAIALAKVGARRVSR
jgi:hypothetical protein